MAIVDLVLVGSAVIAPVAQRVGLYESPEFRLSDPEMKAFDVSAVGIPQAELDNPNNRFTCQLFWSPNDGQTWNPLGSMEWIGGPAPEPGLPRIAIQVTSILGKLVKATLDVQNLMTLGITLSTR